jgi:hypothetical protein
MQIRFSLGHPATMPVPHLGVGFLRARRFNWGNAPN